MNPNTCAIELPCTIQNNADGSISFVGMTPEFATDLIDYAADAVIIENRRVGFIFDGDKYGALKAALCDEYGMMLSCTYYTNTDGFVTFETMHPEFVEHLLGFAEQGANDASIYSEYRAGQIAALSDALYDLSDLYETGDVTE